LTALVAKFTTCSHPASNIVFMMVLLIGIVYLFPFIDVVSHSMATKRCIHLLGRYDIPYVMSLAKTCILVCLMKYIYIQA
jgi:hypothetical protein